MHKSTTTKLTIRAARACKWDLVSLGEVMLRFDPGEGRIVGSRSFNVWEGGGEYNVARGLRRCFQQRSAIVTALVDNPVGRLVEDLMLQGGVGLDYLQWREFDGVGRKARNGVYFLERGFGVRGGLGMMDRGNTAISQLKPGDVDWNKIFSPKGDGVRWFHTGGVMAALSENSTAVVREAMTAAKKHGTLVSFDCNYRPSLWKTRGGRKGSVKVNRELMPLVDVLFGHEGDVAEVLTEAAHGPVWHTLESFAPMAERVVSEFPNLKVIASTVRKPITANRNGWSAFGYMGGKSYEALKFDDLEILDRVGGGDSFASGLIYGLLNGKGMKWSLDCGVAHGALAMTTAGDSSMASLAEVERLMAGGSAGTVR
ncbi:sugar kinase [Granulicella paludicola]|uniref:sugar kinase n=1 Tax=Granulicella paludicola TaxID=474951 RepID=UPI0021E0B084|nr:sugar kinase [Granulicella paludicola]